MKDTSVCAAGAAAIDSTLNRFLLCVCCNEWLFMCAWFFALVDFLFADRSVASRLLGATAASVILLFFAAGHCKSYWSGCIKAATVIWQQIFSILALAIFL